MRITKKQEGAAACTLVVVEHTDFEVDHEEIKNALLGYDVEVIAVEQKHLQYFMTSGLYDVIHSSELRRTGLPSASIAPISVDTLIDLCTKKDTRKLV